MIIGSSGISLLYKVSSLIYNMFDFTERKLQEGNI
jgi:hypothetical protein